MTEYRKQGSSVYRDTGRRQEFCGCEWVIVQRYASGTAFVETMQPEQWEKLEPASAADWKAGEKEHAKLVAQEQYKRDIDSDGWQYVRETGKQYPARGSFRIPKDVLAKIEREAGGRERVDFVKERAKAARAERAWREDEENTAETEREMLADFIAAREDGDA